MQNQRTQAVSLSAWIFRGTAGAQHSILLQKRGERCAADVCKSYWGLVLLACWPPNAESPRLLRERRTRFRVVAISCYRVARNLRLWSRFSERFGSACRTWSAEAAFDSVQTPAPLCGKSPASFFRQTIYLLHHTPSFLQRQVGNQTAVGFRFCLQPGAVHNAFSKGACDKQLIHCALVL